MARGEESAALQQTAYQRARRSVVVAICTIACFAAFFGFALNQHGSEKSELEGKLKIRAGVSSRTPISAYHKLSTKSSLDEDAVDWAEEEVDMLHI